MPAVAQPVAPQRLQSPVEARLRELLASRILVLDGAMGTMIQRYRLTEEQFRGERFAAHARDVKGNNELLSLTRPSIITEIHEQYLAAGAEWSLANDGHELTSFHWIRKAYEPLDDVAPPRSFVTSDAAVEPRPMPDTDGAWATTRFVDPDDLGHDMHVNIVTFQPGGVIPFAETHVMEHGLYVLEGKGVYRLNGDWVEVEAGDFMWLRAFCPQACYAGGPGPFRYLLYKDVNRQVRLTDASGGPAGGRAW